MNNIPQVHKLSKASQLSLVAVVILLGAIFFTVNSAIEQQNTASHASVSNILANPGCESGTSGYSGYNASISTVSSPVHSGSSSCKVVSTGGSFYDITATQANSYPNPQAGQTFSGYAYVRADSNTGGHVYVAMQEWNGSTLVKSTYGNAVTLTTNWQLVTNTTTWSASGTRVIFYVVQDPGSGGQSFYVDDMYFSPGTFSGPVATVAPTFIQPTLAPTAPPTPLPTATPGPPTAPPLPPASGNLLLNPSFENGTNNWLLYTQSPASGTFTTTTSTAEDGNASAIVHVTGTSYSNTSANDWYVQLYQQYLPVQQGQAYTVSFWAKANVNRPIEAMVQQTNSPYATYGDKVFNITTSWQKYSYTFTANASQSNASVEFSVAETTGYVWIDNVCYSTGSCSPTLAPTAVPTALPTPTPYPTAIPTPTPSPTPSLLPSPSPSVGASPSPTSIPVPTDTPAPGSTVLTMTIGLHGIGTGGDSANPTSTGNTSPLRPTRTITVDVYDVNNQLVMSQQGTATYDTGSGKFDGSVNLGTSFTTGLYTVKVKTDQYLRALVPGIQSITAGQANTLPLVTLVAGDINGDNAINIIDYNILIGCYSDLLPATDCNATNNVLADLNDDGHVNEFDYNLFLRELTNIGGQ